MNESEADHSINELTDPKRSFTGVLCKIPHLARPSNSLEIELAKYTLLIKNSKDRLLGVIPVDYCKCFKKAKQTYYSFYQFNRKVLTLNADIIGTKELVKEKVNIPVKREK